MSTTANSVEPVDRQEPGALPAVATKSSASIAGKWCAATYFAGLVGMLLVVFGINFLGNANSVMPSPYRMPASELAWKTRRLEEMIQTEGPPQILILGSSRSLQMKPALIRAITGKKTFNYSLSAGKILDSLAQLRYAIKIGAKPEMLILNIDEYRLLDGKIAGNRTLPCRPSRTLLGGPVSREPFTRP